MARCCRLLSSRVSVRHVTASTRPADQAPDDALASQTAIRSLQQELELARARERRLQVDNHRLATALEQAERQWADLSTLHEEAEFGRRARDAALRLQMLESSTIWRLTRPLRIMSMAARYVSERLRQR